MEAPSRIFLTRFSFLQGNFYSIRNDHARAIQYFTRALRMNPDYPAAWILLGHEFVEGKNHAAAINAYREALGKRWSVERYR